jgi:site-specific recombinase XerD
MTTLSNSERQRLFRQRQREAVGDDEFRLRQNQARRARRAAAKARNAPNPEIQARTDEVKQAVGADITGLIGDIQTLLITARTQPNLLNLPEVKAEIKQKLDTVLMPVINCDTLNRQIQKQDGKASLKTIADYQNQIRILHKKMNPKVKFDCKNYEFLRDVNKVIKFIKDNYKPASQSKKINSITSILKRLKGFNKEYNEYSKINISTAQALSANIDTNQLSTAQRKQYLPWADILQAEAKITAKRDKMLYSLYTKIPPRRLEYRTLLLTQGQPKSTDVNYLVMNKGTPEKIILNNYKTAHLYKQYVIDLSRYESLQQAIKAYIKSAGIYSGDYLFRKKAENQPISQSYFSRMLQTLFNKYTGKKISVNLLRHSFITDTRKSKLSVADKKNIARQMGHSVGMADKYEKFEN